MLTAVHLTATGVTKNNMFMEVPHRAFNWFLKILDDVMKYNEEMMVVFLKVLFSWIEIQCLRVFVSRLVSVLNSLDQKH